MLFFCLFYDNNEDLSESCWHHHLHDALFVNLVFLAQGAEVSNWDVTQASGLQGWVAVFHFAFRYFI